MPCLSEPTMDLWHFWWLSLETFKCPQICAHQTPLWHIITSPKGYFLNWLEQSLKFQDFLSCLRIGCTVILSSPRSKSIAKIDILLFNVLKIPLETQPGFQLEMPLRFPHYAAGTTSGDIYSDTTRWQLVCLMAITLAHCGNVSICSLSWEWFLRGWCPLKALLKLMPLLLMPAKSCAQEAQDANVWCQDPAICTSSTGFQATELSAWGLGCPVMSCLIKGQRL